jgi:Right handed beta helix region
MTTFYVAATGSDKQSGTQTSPWETVSRVNHQALKPGDRVLFRSQDVFADAQLIPPSSGSRQQFVTYGCYGTGRATITQGVWSHASCVALHTLVFNAQVQAGTNGGVTVTDWAVVNAWIIPPVGNKTLGVNYNGDRLALQRSWITGTGLSGVQMYGDTAMITGCTITDVGLFDAGYNAHGIYLDASNVEIADNAITRFSESAVSARYHSSTITANVFDTGQIGIDFYQTDEVAGMSVWTGNTIRNTTAAGIYTTDGDYPLRESFTIRQNTIVPPANAAGWAGDEPGEDVGVLWRAMNLGKTSGSYVLS